MILQPGDMELCRNFEEEFARDVWNSRLPKKVALDTSLSVVSLASFRGDFAVIRSCYFSMFTSFILISIP